MTRPWSAASLLSSEALAKGDARPKGSPPFPCQTAQYQPFVLPDALLLVTGSRLPKNEICVICVICGYFISGFDSILMGNSGTLEDAPCLARNRFVHHLPADRSYALAVHHQDLARFCNLFLVWD
jgi:hypothetical protein